MKNSKFTKIIAMMAALIVLVCAVGIVASAEGETLSVKINARNVSYGDLVKVLFAVDDTNAGGKEVELLYYLEDPTVNPEAEAFNGVKYDKGYTDKKNTDDTSDDVTYPAFFTAGFPAKHIGDYVYARAHIVDTDVYSAVERYSIVEYLLERLYVDRATGDKAELYKYLLGYGTYAQKVVLNGNDDPADDVKKFINELVLVAIPGGTLDGKYAQGTYFAGDVITPSIDGAKGLNVTVFDLTTGLGETELVANGASVTVEGFTMITASEEEPETPGTPETPIYKPDLSDTTGRILWSESTNIDDYKSLGYIDYWMGSGAPIAIVDGAPYGEASKILRFATQTHEKDQDQIFIRNTSGHAGSVVAAFEADMLVNPSAATQYEIKFMNSTLASADRTAYTLYLSVGTDGIGGISGTGFDKVVAPDVAGNWFRLRAEYHDVSATQFKIVVYFNGMKVADTDAMDKPKGADHASAVINQVLLAATKASVAEMYLDNTKVSHDAPAYTPNMSDLASRETYEDGDDLNLFSYNLWVNNSGNPLPNVTASPYGVASKVAFADNTARAYAEIGFEQKTIPSGTKVYRFETDMMIANPASSVLVKFDLSGANKFAFSIYGNTVMLNSNQSNSSPVTVVASVGEWFRFAVECFADESGNNVYRILINEQQVGATYASAVAPNAITKARFICDANKGANLYFDNTKVEFLAQ